MAGGVYWFHQPEYREGPAVVVTLVHKTVAQGDEHDDDSPIFEIAFYPEKEMEARTVAQLIEEHTEWRTEVSIEEYIPQTTTETRISDDLGL